MTPPSTQSWEAYVANELAFLTPLMRTRGYTLDETQVHTRGERYLFVGVQDVGAGARKLVLTGKRADGVRVVLKCAADPASIREIERERTARAVIHELDFAQHTFSAPPELDHFTLRGRRCVVTAYLAESKTFMEHPVIDQFLLALRALEMQEGVHATTAEHARAVQVLGMVDQTYYRSQFSRFAAAIERNAPDTPPLHALLARASSFLDLNQELIGRYSGFLTHSDFSPQNMRIQGREIYLLDFASMYFGNKYESWARLINFMTQHGPELERYLVAYVRDNRSPDEYRCLRALQVYKLSFLLQFHTSALHNTIGDLHELTVHRIQFWSRALTAVLEDTLLPPETAREYLATAARLKSGDEKARQREILAREQLSV